MAIPVYLYADGNDPFVFPFGTFEFYVFAGAPPSAASGSTTGSAPGIQVTPPSGSGYLPTPIPPPIALAYVSGPDEIREWLNTAKQALGDQPARFRLDAVSGPSRPEIGTLLEGLQDLGEHDVSVDIVCWSGPEDG
jgi:hypothetical protein